MWIFLKFIYENIRRNTEMKCSQGCILYWFIVSKTPILPVIQKKKSKFVCNCFLTTHLGSVSPVRAFAEAAHPACSVLPFDLLCVALDCKLLEGRDTFISLHILFLVMLGNQFRKLLPLRNVLQACFMNSKGTERWWKRALRSCCPFAHVFSRLALSHPHMPFVLFILIFFSFHPHWTLRNLKWFDP